jgi:predicted RNA methylase
VCDSGATAWCRFLCVSLLITFALLTGTGNMTMKLLEKAKKVVAIELDPRMVRAWATKRD